MKTARKKEYVMQYIITSTGRTSNRANLFADFATWYNGEDDVFAIKKVHFNDPATVVIWEDGTKTVVKCGEEDIYDPQTGLLMCIAKKAYGNKGKFNDILREWVSEEQEIDPVDYINTTNSVVDVIRTALTGGKADD